MTNQGANDVSEVASRPEVRMDAELLGRILDHTAFPLFVKDRAFRFVLLNQAACTLFGTPRHGQLGKTDYDLFSREEADFFRLTDEKMFATGEVQIVEQEPLTDLRGERHALATIKVPLRNEAGEVEFLVGMIHDLSALREAEALLKRSNEELETRVRQRTEALAAAHEELMRKERLAAIGQIAGGVAHQIRSPLAVIGNSAQLLKKLAVARGDPAICAQADIVLEEIWRANATVSGLIDFARFRPPRTALVAPSAIVTRVLGAAALPPNVELLTELPALPAVSVDPEQVREALGNLVQNAIEAMPEGGRLSVSGRSEGELVVLTVCDSGVGISPENQRRLFQPLVTTKSSGLGLGLTTARMLIENQRGTISFQSEQGRGTCFEVRLQTSAPTPA